MDYFPVRLETASTSTALGAAACRNGAGRPQVLVAAKDIPAGAVVVASAAVAHLVEDPSVCSFCMQKKPELLRCAACKSVQYCDRGCQRADWGMGHKAECKALGRLSVLEQGARSRALLLARFLRFVEEDRAGGVTAGTTVADAFYMPTVADIGAALDEATNATPSPQLVADAASIHRAGGDAGLIKAAADHASESMRDMVSSCLQVRSPGEVATAIARLSASSFPLLDQTLSARGMGVYPVGALIAHSCAPNVVPSYVSPEVAAAAAAMEAAEAAGAPAPLTPPSLPPLTATGPLVQVFRALRPIAAGELITHSYADLTLAAPLRQGELHRSLGGGYVCACSACTAPDAADLGPLRAADGSETASMTQDDMLAAAEHPDVALARDVFEAGGDFAQNPAGKAYRPLMERLEASGFVKIEESGVLQADVPRMHAALLLHSLTLLRRHLPAFHPQCRRFADQIYPLYLFVGDMAGAAAASHYIAASYRHGCRHCPTHPMLAFQIFGHAECRSNDLLQRTMGLAAGQLKLPEETVAKIQTPADKLGEAFSVPAGWDAVGPVVGTGAEGDDGVPPELAELKVAAALYQHAADALRQAYGPLHPVVRMAEARTASMEDTIGVFQAAVDDDAAKAAH